MIPTDGSKHSADPDPSFFGESIGWWEGDTLVIDSIGFMKKYGSIRMRIPTAISSILSSAGRAWMPSASSMK